MIIIIDYPPEHPTANDSASTTVCKVCDCLEPCDLPRHEPNGGYHCHHHCIILCGYHCHHCHCHQHLLHHIEYKLQHQFRGAFLASLPERLVPDSMRSQMDSIDMEVKIIILSLCFYVQQHQREVRYVDSMHNEAEYS